MANSTHEPGRTDAPRKRHKCIALVLQGGGALGAYQAGVFEALSNSSQHPDWVVGVSIGAINAALIAGNPPERRVERLSEFWHRVSSGMGVANDVLSAPQGTWSAPELVHARSAFSQFSALWSVMLGIPGFYQPRVPPVWFQPEGTSAALGIYDNTPLRQTLEQLIDFDLINKRKVRLSMGAVNVRTGNSEYFDNFEHIIGPEHVMASGALPPAFAPVVIDGEAYWDGGIVSNTPLQYVLDMRADESLLIFQVDLFSARGEIPLNISQVQQRQKDIVYSSRTRFNSNMAAEVANTRTLIGHLLKTLPDSVKDDPAVRKLARSMKTHPTDVVHLIYRPGAYELESKDYEFSRVSMLERWQAGQRDLGNTLSHPDWMKCSGRVEGVRQFDLTRPE